MKDALGDRMKFYEDAESARVLMPGIPVIARMDGKGFSKFTDGMVRPHDERFRACMVETTKRLIEETGADMGYTQSDEITLAWANASYKEEMWFAGRIQKINSHLAGRASIYFMRAVMKIMPEYLDREPSLDARVWNVPTREEGANSFLWREQDATKNAITMAASEFYNYEELLGVNGRQRIEMLYEKGVNFSDYPVEFRRGVFMRRVKTSVPFTAEELEMLPEKHHARLYDGVTIERSSVQAIPMPRFGSVANRSDVIFEAAKPILISDLEVEVTEETPEFEVA
jgi:tRNA(His) guanylyltransferase